MKRRTKQLPNDRQTTKKMDTSKQKNKGLDQKSTGFTFHSSSVLLSSPLTGSNTVVTVASVPPTLHCTAQQPKKVLASNVVKK